MFDLQAPPLASATSSHLHSNPHLQPTTKTQHQQPNLVMPGHHPSLSQPHPSKTSQYYEDSSLLASSKASTPSNVPCYSSDSNDSTLSNSPNSSKSSNGSVSNCSSRSSSTSPVGVNLRVTGQCSQGGRKYMEDYFSVAYQQSENAKDLEYAYIGIFDGHGGAEAAIFAKEHLMMEIIKQKQFWSENDHDVLRAIREGYIATHYAMWRDQENWPKTSNGLPSTAGTTATIAFIRREKIYIGHVGDSGIVLGYQNENEDFWRAKSLTNDHKPESMQERNRIRRAYGKVMVKSGVPRVVWRRPRNPGHAGPIRFNTVVDEIPFLAVARSLGDLWSYNPENRQFVVSPDPDVKVVRINPKTFRCLIFGTDGLWNVLGAQDAVKRVFEKEDLNKRLNPLKQKEGIYEDMTDSSQWANPSKALVEDALRIWNMKRMRADNTSVVTVILYPSNDDSSHFTGEKSQAPHLPFSYGFDYTEIQADIPLYKDPTTYAELSQKFQPPEAYRNFNYYDIEGASKPGNEAANGEENEAETESEEETEILEIRKEEKTFVTSVVTKGESSSATAASSSPALEASAATLFNDLQVAVEANLVPSGEEEEHESSGSSSSSDEDEEDDEEDEATHQRNLNNPKKTRRSIPSFSEWTTSSKCNLFVNNLMENSPLEAASGSSVPQPERDESSKSSSNHSDVLDGFTDIGLSFAESFNCLLQNQDSPPDNQTILLEKSSLSYDNMQEIFKEHQTMSEQEGYSLTKLETRQEKAQNLLTNHLVASTPTPAPEPKKFSFSQTNHLLDHQEFKKFNSFNNHLMEESSNHQLNPPQQHQHIPYRSASRENASVSASAGGSLSSNTFYNAMPSTSKSTGSSSASLPVTQPTKIVEPLEPPPENKYQAAAATSSTTSSTTTSTCEFTELLKNVGISYEEEFDDDEDHVEMEENPGTSSAVQINEISSSNINENTLEESLLNSLEDLNKTLDFEAEGDGDGDDDGDEGDEEIEIVENIEILATKASTTTTTSTTISSGSSSNKELKRISTLWNLASKSSSTKTLNESLPKASSFSSLKRSYAKANLNMSAASSTTTLPPKRTKSKSFYPNVPNENHSLSRNSFTSNNTSRNKNPLKRSRSSQSELASSSAFSSSSAQQLSLEKRQLRSSVSNFGSSFGSSNGLLPQSSNNFIKKTLRTRNILSKGLKSTGSFISSTSGASGSSSNSKEFLLNGSRKIASTGNLSAMASSMSSPLKTAVTTVINLRSRRSSSNTPSTRSASSNHLDYRRNLRSLGPSNTSLSAPNPSPSLRSTHPHNPHPHHLHSHKANGSDSSSKPSSITTIKITPSGFSKTTNKLQNNGLNSGSLGLAPPPSPKVISSLQSPISTRTRSLQNAKSSASLALMKAFVPKKSSLRSNSCTGQMKTSTGGGANGTNGTTTLYCDRSGKILRSASSSMTASGSGAGAGGSSSASSSKHKINFVTVVNPANLRTRTTRQKR